MTDLFGFRGGPVYQGSSKSEVFQAALAQPMNAGATLWDQAKGGVLDSFGLGSAIRDIYTPEGNPERTVQVAEPAPLAAYYLAKTVVQSFINDPQPSLTEDQYKASTYYRADIPYDPAMTEDRAASLADWYDAKKVREYFGAKRPWLSFFSGMAGQAVDPVNYIPIAGPLVKAAAMERFGWLAGGAVTGALDAASNTAVFGIGTRETRRQYGDDVSWQSTVSQIATAALIGGAFGTIGGGMEGRADAKFRSATEERLSTLRTTQEARVALNEAIGSVARGEDIALSPNATEPIARVARKVVYPDQEMRQATIDRIVNQDMPLGAEPKKPVTLMQFLTGRAVGGIRDEGGELATMGLSRKFIPGGGSLVTRRGKSIEYAREAAAEAGYFDHLYGDPETAVAKSTPDDLLRMLRQEASGEPVYSPRNDGGRVYDQADYQMAQAAQDSYRRVIDEIDHATETLGIKHQIDDAIIRKAAAYSAHDGLDPAAALEQAMEDDYRAFNDALSERGQGFANEPDIPFFADTGTGRGTGQGAGAARQGIGPGGRGTDAAYSRQSAGARGNEGQAVGTSGPRPEPLPEGRKQAEAAIAKPDDIKALAAQYRVDPETGSYFEEPDIKQLETEGRLTEDDKAELDAAQVAFEDGSAYGEALRAAVGCLV